MANRPKRWAYLVWLIVVFGFGVLHALHLGADFPNHTPWILDWAKYTDEGWWGNAAMRAHLLGNWYLPGDFNPAPAVPAWPFFEWIVFGVTGVSIEAARGLAVAFFFANLVLGYLLLAANGPRWTALLAVTLLATNPFLYCFSRLAILEPMLIAFTLAALNLAVRVERCSRPVAVSAAVGVLFTLMMLSKTSAVFLALAVAWALIVPLWSRRKLVFKCALAAAAAFAVTFGAWMALVVHLGLLNDYRYLFFINKYTKPTEFYWPLLSLWWSIQGGLWADRILIPLAGLVLVAALLAWRKDWSRRLRRNPAFGASLLAVAGYLLFMTYQNHPQPRYYAVIAFFCFFVVAMGIGAMMSPGPQPGTAEGRAWKGSGALWTGYAFLVAAVIAAFLNAEYTMELARHPEYTFESAAQKLTRYVDEHPNGKRLLVSTSGDQITMISHLPSICDDFGTESLVEKLKDYQPGWFATWNDIDPGTLEDLHNFYSLEQVASFHAMDHPERNVLVLFKLHRLPGGTVRDPGDRNLQVALPGDRIYVPIE